MTSLVNGLPRMDSRDTPDEVRRKLKPSIPSVQEQAETELKIVAIGKANPDRFVDVDEPIEEAGGQLLRIGVPRTLNNQAPLWRRWPLFIGSPRRCDREGAQRRISVTSAGFRSPP
jgi:hypothetical protein